MSDTRERLIKKVEAYRSGKSIKDNFINTINDILLYMEFRDNQGRSKNLEDLLEYMEEHIDRLKC